MASQEEIRIKDQRIREWLAANGFAGVLLTRRENFAWAACGARNYVVSQSDMGFATLVVTRDRKYCFTTNIEAPRISQEELEGQGYEMRVYPWTEAGGRVRLLREALPIGRPGADEYMPGTDIMPANFAEIRYSLTAHEVERYRKVGADCGEAIAEVMRGVVPGEAEYAIAARTAAAALARNVQPCVILVAADERVDMHRHPIFTDKKARKKVMVVLCGERHGLVCSVTRLAHFGKLPDELRRKHDAATAIEAAMIHATRPGAAIGDIFQTCVNGYEEAGFPGEWKLHHQGGPCGYAARDFLATPGETRVVQPNQAFAWNPSIAGTKSEDTLIVLEGKPEVISLTGGWPTISHKVGGVAYARPDILVK